MRSSASLKRSSGNAINKRRAQRISAPAFPNELLHDFKIPHVHFIGAPLLLVIHFARQPHPRLRRYPIGTKDPLADFYRYLSGIILKYILVFAEASVQVVSSRAFCTCAAFVMV